MPIERTTKYICDGCGKEINYWRDRYETMCIETHNYNDSWEYVNVYCESCTRQMWRVVRAIPEIVKANKEESN